MRKIFLALSLLLLSVITYAQDESVYDKAIIVKFNPTLMVTSGFAGEFGGDIQYNINNSFGAFLGGGYNLTTPVYNPVNNAPGYSIQPSAGYTIRAGGYYFFGEGGKYISVQLFYRQWLNTTVFNYDFGYGDNSNVSTDYTTEGTYLGGISSDESAVTSYYVTRASVTVVGADFLYGKQMLKGFSGHFLFEWFIGAGIRFKTIYQEELGEFQNQQYYAPDTSPIYTTNRVTSPDFKLGIMIGVKL